MEKSSRYLFSYITFFIICTTGYSQAQHNIWKSTPSKDQNYIRAFTVRTYNNSEIGETLETVDYYDGLGRPMQKINVKGSPDGKDVIQPTEYDQFGRQKKEYLPYSEVDSQTNNGKGAYIDSSEAFPAQKDFYNDLFSGQGQYAFSEKEYDGSPLNRVMARGAPGESWQTDQHPVRFEYSSNKSDEVIQWEVKGNSLVRSGYYPENSLFLKITKDENWSNKEDPLHTSEEFTNIQGKTVLKRTWLEKKNGQYIDASTYYVYDDFDLLRFVISPKAIEDGKVSGEELDGLCYQYRYDGRKRMIWKKLPGAEPVKMVYDKRDRLVFTQDGNQRKDSVPRWSYTLYDHLNREKETGLYVHDGDAAISRSDLQSLVSEQDPADLRLDGSYTAMTRTHYDDYSLDTLKIGGAASAEEFCKMFDEEDFKRSKVVFDTDSLRGLQTGSSVRILDTTYSSRWLHTFNYYDNKGRVLRTISNNHLGGYEVVLNRYNFAGDVTKTKHVHKVKDRPETAITKSFEYDHAGRLLQVSLSINEEDPITISRSEYDELDQLSKKFLHDDKITTTFDYNIRGWMTGINDIDGSSGFGMELKYNDGDGARIDSLFNGNIAAMEWFSKGALKEYSFSYDAGNRLKTAEYSGNSGEDYSVGGMEYDVNGNILSLVREGLAPDSSFTTLDSLVYTYYDSTNMLQMVGDSGLNRPDWVDFFDRSGKKDTTLKNSLYDYSYDANGNMTQDWNKAIYDDIRYNHLNLPERIIMKGKGDKSYDNIRFYWDAAGNKLAVRNWKISNLKKDTVVFDGHIEYCGNFVYKRDTLGKLHLSYILFDEGRITTDSSGNYRYEYFIKDHLGNIRLVKRVQGESVKTVQQTDYYPFGKVMGGRDAMPGQNENKYLYNGKELQDQFDLNWYDYGARFYDPALAKFHTIDPLSEKNNIQSPYVYAANNPIRFIDFMGLDSLDAVALQESAENTVDRITEDYGEESAQCNRGVATSFKDLTGSDELDGLTANEIFDYLESSDDFEVISQEDMQDESNEGIIVIGGKKEDDHGHVVLGVPGKEEMSGSWSEKVPQVMDTGSGTRSSKQKISYSWGSGSKDNITYYKYKGETYTSRTYSGGNISAVTVSAKSSTSRYLEPKKFKTTTVKSIIMP